MELTSPPHHTLDQLLYTGLPFSALGWHYMGEKCVCIKVIMMQGNGLADILVCPKYQRVEKKDLLTFLEV